ncbi:hypothetical protein, partial [Klebsiella pneumoniae]|uniref:hypothetical protein n=1 Tax=Klebsiella pneumoniae TaxID=573 RepID=UPI00296E7CBB
MLRAHIAAVLLSNGDPIPDYSGGFVSIRKIGDPVKVRNTPLLPFRKPVKAHHPSTAKALNEILAEDLPILR